ncbi:uncharacterized protein BDV14DRAFT_180370 [Aspergillus stella-maris]|uniref:uncharacterized protein n=1 Tax=Aspergillus stella-maris TaxID=1810926 RepID=UPI003CCE0230
MDPGGKTTCIYSPVTLTADLASILLDIIMLLQIFLPMGFTDLFTSAYISLSAICTIIPPTSRQRARH